MGGYDIRLDLTFLMDQWMRHLIWQCWRRGSYLSWETEDSWMMCGCSMMGHLHTSLFLRAMFWTNIFQATGLAVAHWHLQYHCHGHHVVLTLPHQTIHFGVLSREEWLHVTTTTMKICAELWKMPFAQLLQKCSDVFHRVHGGASVRVSSIKVQIQVHWTCNQGVHKWFKSNYGSVLVGVRWLLAHPVESKVLSWSLKPTLSPFITHFTLFIITFVWNMLFAVFWASCTFCYAFFVKCAWNGIIPLIIGPWNL